MKVSLLCLCVLVHVALVHAGLFVRNELQQTASSRKAKTTQSTGSTKPVRQKPLFARRGQYERQSVPKRVRVVSQHGPPPPSKVVPRPVKPTCSQLGQSCLPQSGCCETQTMCHCRFFNAICFCRRRNSVKKT